MNKYDEVWALEAEPVLEYFRDQLDVSVIPMPAKKIGSVELPQTRIIIGGDDADAVHKRFFYHFLKAGG